jgi:hypothetical protein
MAGKTRPKTLPGHRTELGQPNLSKCSQVDAKSRDATRNATSRKVPFPRRPKTAVAAPPCWRHGSGRGWFSPHGWSSGLSGRWLAGRKREKATASRLSALFWLQISRKNIQRSLGREKQKCAWRDKIYNYCCSGLKRQTCSEAHLGSHTRFILHSLNFFSLLITHVQDGRSAETDAIKCDSDEGFYCTWCMGRTAQVVVKQNTLLFGCLWLYFLSW